MSLTKMKVTTANSNSDLSVLKYLEEPIVIYTSNKEVQQKILKIRDEVKYLTIVIFDNYNKTINQLILEYRDQLADQGIVELEPFELGENDKYTVPVFMTLVLLAILIIIIITVCRSTKRR